MTGATVETTITGGQIAIEQHDFARAVLNNAKPEIDGHGGLTALAAVVGVFESNKLGRPVTMDEMLTLPGVARKTANVVLNVAFGENRFELAHAELLGSDTIERREMAHEDEIAPAVAAGGLDRDDIGG